MDMSFDYEGDEAAFAEQERAFDAYMQEYGELITEDEQERYNEWCEQNGLNPAVDYWEEYYDSLIPGDEL